MGAPTGSEPRRSAAQTAERALDTATRCPPGETAHRRISVSERAVASAVTTLPRSAAVKSAPGCTANSGRWRVQVRVRVDAPPSCGCTSKCRCVPMPLASPESPTKPSNWPACDLRAVLQARRIRRPGDALAAVVVAVRQVVVQMDVQVRRAALPVQVEHAAGRRGVRPELDLAGLGRDGERAARGHDVVPLVWPCRARRAEVVRVLHRPTTGKTKRRRSPRGLGRGCGCVRLDALSARPVLARVLRGLGDAAALRLKGRVATREIPPRAVVRWRRIRLRFALEGPNPSKGSGALRDNFVPKWASASMVIVQAMKIAVCVKQVPDAARRSGSTRRRSGSTARWRAR